MDDYFCGNGQASAYPKSSVANDSRCTCGFLLQVTTLDIHSELYPMVGFFGKLITVASFFAQEALLVPMYIR